MSADPAEILPPELVAPQAGESDVAALMARGGVESRIAANLKLLEALQHVPESTCADQRDRLTGEIGTLTVLLDLPDDELVVAAPGILRTSKSRPPQDKPTPPVVLYEVLPVQEDPDEAPTEEAKPDIYARISQAKATFLDLIQHASTLPEEEVYRVVDAINDACDETYAAIGQAVEEIKSTDDPIEVGPKTESSAELKAEAGAESSFRPTGIVYDEIDIPDDSSLIEEVIESPVVPLIIESASAISQPESPLPSDFRQRVMVIANETATFNANDVRCEIFGPSLLPSNLLSALYRELQAMVDEGALERRKSLGLSLPGGTQTIPVARAKEGTSEFSASTKPKVRKDNLSSRLGAVGISPKSSPFHRRRH